MGALGKASKVKFLKSMVVIHLSSLWACPSNIFFLCSSPSRPTRCFGSLSAKWDYLFWNINVRHWEELATWRGPHKLEWLGGGDSTGYWCFQRIVHPLVWAALKDGYLQQKPQSFRWLMTYILVLFSIFFPFWGLQQLKQHCLATQQFQLSLGFEMATLLNVCDLFLEQHFSCQFP